MVWESMGVDHTASDMSTSTVTLEIPADLAYYLKVACADSSGVWHQHWRDVTDGKRSDLDATACASLSRKAWELWEVLHSQGV